MWDDLWLYFHPFLCYLFDFMCMIHGKSKNTHFFLYILPCFYFDVASYSIRIYLQKNWETHNHVHMDKEIYNSNMNSTRVVIENTFGSLKKIWWFLRHFNSKLDRVALMIISCYVLHNYCEMWGALEPRLANAKTMGDNLARFGVNRLPTVKNQKKVKD